MKLFQILVIQRKRFAKAGRPRVEPLFHGHDAYAASLVARGLLWGNVAGIGLALLQQHTHAVKLDAEGYNVAAVPVDLDAGWIAGIDIGFAATILLLLAAATTIVSRIRPADTIKYE